MENRISSRDQCGRTMSKWSARTVGENKRYLRVLNPILVPKKAIPEISHQCEWMAIWRFFGNFQTAPRNCIGKYFAWFVCLLAACHSKIQLFEFIKAEKLQFNDILAVFTRTPNCLSWHNATYEEKPAGSASKMKLTVRYQNKTKANETQFIKSAATKPKF